MLTSLEILDLEGCSCLESFPEVLGKMEKIREIYLDKTAIVKLPFSIGNFVGLQLLSLKQCQRLNQLPGSICTLRKVEVIFGYGHGRYQFFEENQDEEELSSEVSPRAMLISDFDLGVAYLDVYYSYISPNNVIQVCSPNPLMHGDFDLSFQKLGRHEDWYRRCRKSSMHFSFRNKFPKIVVCCSIMPSLKVLMVLIFKFSVLINGSKQFSSSCNCIFNTWKPILWCDLDSKAEGIFSEQEWNEAEILFELKYPTLSGVALETHNHNSGYSTRGNLDWTLIGVYEEGNNEDIEFKAPISTFSFPNRELPSSLPSCLYYVVSDGNE